MLALRNLRVGSRLGAGFGLLLLFIVAIVGLALYGNHLKSTQFEKVVDVNMVKMRLLNEMLDTNNAVLMQRRLMVIKRGEDFDRDYRKAPYGPSTSRFRVMPPAIRWSRGSTRHAGPPTRPPGNCMSA